MEEYSAKPNPKFIPNNPNAKNSLHIGGIKVEFPFKPYGTQLSFMNRVISTLDRSQNEGHCHALLESPTGTGKSLSLLCSALAWQQNQKLKNIRSNLTHSSSKADPQALADPINHGGGFVPETQPSGNPAIAPPATGNGKKEKQRMAPTIFYSTRTHAQITQVVREYRKTTYRGPMSILGSRKHYCTSPYLRGTDNVDEQCKLLLKNTKDACPEFKNVHKVKGHPSLQKGGCHEAHDIEDLVKIGHTVKGCSYFAARSMAQEAELVFCPYNYIINPIIRNAMEVDINKSIIIFDEAHNIEDITRDAGSVDLEEDALTHLQTELIQLALMNEMTYQPLYEMTQDIVSWIDRRKNNLVKREYQHYFQCWTGNKALKELQEANISLQSFPALQECAKKAIRAAAEAEPDVAILTGMAANALEGLFSSLSYFFSANGLHANDYELALQRFANKDGGGWTNTFSLWCLNPSVVFKDIAEASQSVILTSGTLSPLNTFSSELGIQFGSCLEAPHVIDVDSQVWAAAIANGPGNYPLNASFKTSDKLSFQDSVGKSLEDICTAVPGGCLVFFPSYKLLDKVSTRWKETGQWSRLNARKTLFVEPRGSSQDRFETVLKGYYNSILGTKKRGKRLGMKNGKKVEPPKGNTKEGAAFLAVCRGKVSEGMDFSDDNARAVVIVGIPFPNMYDTKVAQKKKFNDINESSKNLLSGNDWYCQQAFRALNQAAGRCIRHRFDYGAVIFLDERFHKDRNRAYISKWLRKSIRLYDCFEESMEGLKSFFKDVKERVDKAAKAAAIADVDRRIVETQDNKSGPMQTNQKVTKASRQQKASELTQSPNVIGKYNSFTTHAITEVVQLDDDNDTTTTHHEYIDLECDSKTDSRCCATPLVSLPLNDSELTVVKETPGMSMNFKSPVSTSKIFSKDDDSSPIMNLPSTTHKQPFPFHPTPILSSFADWSKIMRSELATTDRDVTAETNFIEPEAESRSVNSHDWKRRKLLSPTGPVRALRTPVQILDSYSFLASSITASDANHMAEEMNHSGKFNKCRPSCSSSDSDGSDEPAGLNMDERLKIFCSRCRYPLGLPENELYVLSSTLSLSKVHLTSLWKETSEIVGSSITSVDILASDLVSVNHRLCQTAHPGISGQGIWCKEDGCVFNSIFCPFCADPDNCLGVQVLATDASNIKFQNKILFYRDRLEVENSEPISLETVSRHGDSGMFQNESLSRTDEFTHTSPTQDNLNLNLLKNASSSKTDKFACTLPAQDNGGSSMLKNRSLCTAKKFAHTSPDQGYGNSSILEGANYSNIEKSAYTPPARDNGSSTMSKDAKFSHIDKFAYTPPAEANGDSDRLQNASLSKIEKFAYTPPAQDSTGWRNPKSRMRLPKKG